MGYNFGTDYNGFPYVGIAMMILNCTFAGCILTMINPIHLAFILQIPIYILGIICFYHKKKQRLLIYRNYLIKEMQYRIREIA